MAARDLNCTDPQFLPQVFAELLEREREHPLAQLFDLRAEAHLSYLFDLSAIQEGERFRALSRARRLALLLVDGGGEVRKDFLKEIANLYEREGAFFYPQGTSDFSLYEHILGALRRLQEDALIKSLKRFRLPLCHKGAEMLVLETLGFYQVREVTQAELKAAVLCACLTPLRQNVGSCFATAPAILIQREQIDLFLDDLFELLMTGKLKRTFGGVEYAIPLSPSTGMGDLKKSLIPADQKARAAFSPGLISAFVDADLLPAGRPFEELAEKVREWIERHAQGLPQLTVEELIRKVLLENAHVTQDDLSQMRLLEAAQVRNAQHSFGTFDPSGAHKLEQIQRFQQKEKRVRSAFKGICDNALLKAWEFTLASFSEVKMEFSRWNLYSSLGLSPKEPGGIGELIHRHLEEKIDEVNKKIKEYQMQYETAFDEVRTVEALMRNISSESEARRLQAEYQARAYHMRACLEMRDRVYAEGANYTNLFSFLSKHYDEKFPEYFQEIYDAEMQDVQGRTMPYDDCPAGFRLVYKHGRKDPSSWTLIYDEAQYSDALVSFFNATESEIAAACEWEGGDREILALTSAIVDHVRKKEFLESALKRMAAAHSSDPRARDKKPWAYTSGGTMTTLLKTYYRRESELTSEEKWVESETELLIFILDTLKNLPPRITDPFLKTKQKGMLISSPTHAFILMPGEEQFRQGWQEEMFTYTWVRDTLFSPTQRFYSEMRFPPAEQRFLLDLFSDQLPPLLGHALQQLSFSKDKNLSIAEWRHQVLEALSRGAKIQPQQAQPFADGLDAFLYQALPLVPGKEWKLLVRRILSDLMNEKVERVLRGFPDVPAPLMTARDVREVAKGCFLLAEGKLSLSFDLHHFVSQHARFVGVAAPTALLLGDTNWTGNFFAFLVNPGTGRLELWRVDRALSQGVPMSAWKPWVSGIDRKAWSIYTHPYEYQMSTQKFF